MSGVDCARCFGEGIVMAAKLRAFSSTDTESAGV